MPPRPSDPAAEARTARHLRNLEELAELGMAMARAVAGAALHPPAAPEAAPSEPAAAPAPKRSDPGLVFARLAHSVRQTIALEARIVAERDNPSGRRPPPAPPPPDPRRALLRRALHDAAVPGTGHEGGRAGTPGFRREVDERIEDELAADPESQLPIEDILYGICHDLGIELDYSRLPDEVLGMADPEPADPDQEPPQGDCAGSENAAVADILPLPCGLEPQRGSRAGERGPRAIDNPEWSRHPLPEPWSALRPKPARGGGACGQMRSPWDDPTSHGPDPP